MFIPVCSTRKCSVDGGGENLAVGFVGAEIVNYDIFVLCLCAPCVRASCAFKIITLSMLPKNEPDVKVKIQSDEAAVSGRLGVH